MLNWLMGLETRGRLGVLGGFGVLANGVLLVVGVWAPVLLVVSLGFLLIALAMKSEDSTDL